MFTWNSLKVSLKNLYFTEYKTITYTVEITQENGIMDTVKKKMQKPALFAHKTAS